MSTGGFQTRFTALMETLIQTAIAETTIIFESIVGELRAEMSKIQAENQHLKCIQNERARSLYTFNSEDRQKVLASLNSDSEKRHIAAQSDVTASSAMLTEQPQSLRIPFVLHGHDYVANARQDRDCHTHDGETIETAVIVAKGEPAFKQQKEELLVDSGRGFINTEISLHATVEDSQMAVEFQTGYQTQSSGALKHTLNIQPATAICDVEISEVCQVKSTTVSTKKFLPSEDQQLLGPAVKLPEKEQMVAAAFQKDFEDKTLFPEQTEDNLQQPVNVQSSVEMPQLASFKKQDFSDGIKNIGATLHPGVVVHFGRGQSPGDISGPQPFVKDGWTHTDNSEPTKQSVRTTVGQKKSRKENLPAVVRLNRLPNPISTVKSVLVSRPPAIPRLDNLSFSTPGPTKDMSSTPAPTTALKMPDSDFSVAASLPLNMSKDHLCHEENSNVSTEEVTVDCRSKNKKLKNSVSPTAPEAVDFKKNEFATSKTTSNPEDGKNKDLLQGCALPERSEEEPQSTTFKPNSKSSKDTEERLPPTSKDQFPAQIAPSAVAKDPEEASSDTVHSIASCTETGESVKTEPKSVLALLQAHMKRHRAPRRTKMSPQTKTQDIKCGALRLACDQSNPQRTLNNSEGTQEPTDIVPTTTVSCQTETVGNFSEFKVMNKPSSVRHHSLSSNSTGHDSQNLSSSPPTFRRSGKPKLSPSLQICKKEIVDCGEARATPAKHQSCQNTTTAGICAKNAGAFISLRGSKRTRELKVVTAKASKVAKSQNCKRQKLQTRVKESSSISSSSSQAVLTRLRLPRSQRTSPRGKKGAQLSAGKDANFQNPPDVLPASGTAVPGTAAPVASPLDPLSFIGSRLLKNQCGKCGQVLPSKAALESHVSLHASDQPFSCSLCGKNFGDSASFKRHSRVHRNGRIHVCQQCGKGFVYRFCLTKHINMVHNHIRPFVCHICNKGCFTKLDVEAHIRMHTGEKPFHCHLCDKKFNRRVNLNVHLRRHNGEKRHWCSFCGKGFLEYNHLKRHKYIHTGEKPHSCPHCPKSFTQSAHLKKHLKTVHKGK